MLVGKLRERGEQFIQEKCEQKGWQILTLAIQLDPLHMFVQCFPSTSVAEVVKECKGGTSFILGRAFSELLKLPLLWTCSYFASTAGDISQETIQKYLDAQKGLH